MKIFKWARLYLIAFALILSSGAQASIIVAIGDVDAVNINYRPQNTQLLDNILGVNTNVLVMGGFANDGRSTSLKSHWDSLAGVSVSTLLSSDVTAGQLLGIDFLFFAENAFVSNSSTADTRSVISGFINTGGDLLYVSQNLDIGPRSSSYNSFLSDIGSSLGTTTANCSAQPPTIVADPLTAGVSDFNLAGCNGVTGGTALVVASNGVVGVAYETIGAVVPEPATLVLLGLGLAGLGFSRRKAT